MSGECDLCGDDRHVETRCPYFNLDGSDKKHSQADERSECSSAEQESMDDSSAKPSVPPMAPSMVDHPPHYLGHPSGIECIQVTEHMTFCLGNAVKYIWRAGLKGDAKEDLQKAVWYIQREILQRESRRTTS